MDVAWRRGAKRAGLGKVAIFFGEGFLFVVFCLGFCVLEFWV